MLSSLVKMPNLLTPSITSIGPPCHRLRVLRRKFKFKGQHLSEAFPHRAPPLPAKFRATLEPVGLVPSMTYNHFRWANGDAA